MSLTAEFLTTLHLLIRTPSVVGAERHFLTTLRRELESLDIRVASYDGVLVAQGNAPESGYLCAHADRNGLIATGPNEFQYAAFMSKYRSNSNVEPMSKDLMMAIQERFINQDVHAYNPWSGSYLGQGIIMSSYRCPRRDNVFFEVQGLENVSPGVPLAYDDKLVQENGWIRAQLDNVLTVSIVVELYRLGYQGTALFSTEEEAGRSWQFIYDYFKRVDTYPSTLLVLDTSPFPSKVEVQDIDLVLRSRDASAGFNTAFTNSIEELSTSLGLRTLKKDDYISRLNKEREQSNLQPLSFGRTELGRLITESKGQLSGTTLQIPTTGYHTSEETTTVKSIEAMITVLKTLFQNS